MAVSEAHKRASNKWNSSRDNIMVRPSKEVGETIRAAAAAAGKSVQAYILQAVQEKMEREAAADGEGAGGVPAGSPAVEDGPGVVMVSAGASKKESIGSRSTSLAPSNSCTGQSVSMLDSDSIQE